MPSYCLFTAVTGLVVAQDYKRGQQLVADRDFDQNADFFQDVFEIGRRYKIMNPEKMRSEFGKLMYMLMDSADTHVQVSTAVHICSGSGVVQSAWGRGRGGVGELMYMLMDSADTHVQVSPDVYTQV